jgi:hypothetical protein
MSLMSMSDKHNDVTLDLLLTSVTFSIFYSITMEYTNMKLSFFALLSSMYDFVCIFIIVEIYLSDIINVQKPEF